MQHAELGVAELHFDVMGGYEGRNQAPKNVTVLCFFPFLFFNTLTQGLLDLKVSFQHCIRLGQLTFDSNAVRLGSVPRRRTTRSRGWGLHHRAARNRQDTVNTPKEPLYGYIPV